MVVFCCCHQGGQFGDTEPRLHHVLPLNKYPRWALLPYLTRLLDAMDYDSCRKVPNLSVIRVRESFCRLLSTLGLARVKHMTAYNIYYNQIISDSAFNLCPPPPPPPLLTQAHINERAVCNAIAPEKDVDGFHIVNIGKLCLDQRSMVPATPAAVWEIIKRAGKRYNNKFRNMFITYTQYACMQQCIHAMHTNRNTHTRNNAYPQYTYTQFAYTQQCIPAIHIHATMHTRNTHTHKLLHTCSNAYPQYTYTQFAYTQYACICIHATRIHATMHTRNTHTHNSHTCSNAYLQYTYTQFAYMQQCIPAIHIHTIAYPHTCSNAYPQYTYTQFAYMQQCIPAIHIHTISHTCSNAYTQYAYTQQCIHAIHIRTQQCIRMSKEIASCVTPGGNVLIDPS